MTSAFGPSGFFDLLTEMAAGNAVMIIPRSCLAYAQQTADALNVSSPFLVSLLEQGKIPHFKDGTHRRVLFEDLMRYKKQIGADRRKVLDELVKQSETMGWVTEIGGFHSSGLQVSVLKCRLRSSMTERPARSASALPVMVRVFMVNG